MLMKAHIARLAISFAVALGFSIAVAFLTDNTPFEFANVIFVPGMLGAALVFPQGIESDHGNAYLAIAGLITALLLTWPIMKLCQVLVVWRRSGTPKGL
jgi:hypothetical protein